MQVITVVLFLIPCSLIYLGWTRHLIGRSEIATPVWRVRCIVISFATVTLGVIAGILAELLWLNVGGDPHGMGSAQGTWQPLLFASRCALLVSVMFGILGKGKGRFFAFGAFAAAMFAEIAIPVLQMQ
jgi:hypothetical protein